MTTEITLKDGSKTKDIKLDRLIEFDEQSRDFPVTKLMGAAPAPLKSKTWDLPRTYFVDQGQEGACVSAGFGHDTAAQPISSGQLSMDWLRQNVYYVAQQEDPWPGGEYPGATPRYGGTSVLTGAKVMQRYGFFESYYWAFNIDQVVQALLTQGTVVCGLWWKSGMFDPQPNGLLDVSGSNEGGHCISIRGIWVPDRYGKIRGIPGVKFDEPVVVIPQSWGLDYGNRGEIYMKLSQLEALLKEDGDCCVPVGRKRVDIRKLNA